MAPGLPLRRQKRKQTNVTCRCHSPPPIARGISSREGGCFRSCSTTVKHLHDALRHNAQRFLDAVIESEADHYLERSRQACGCETQQTVVRNGYQPARSLVTGLGPIALRMPKFRLRNDDSGAFRSTLVPAYRRRMSQTTGVANAAGLYLRGILNRNVGDAIHAVLGGHAPFILPTLGRRFASAWARLCDQLSAQRLHDRSWSGMRALALGLQEGGSMPAQPCAMVLIGQDFNGAPELVHVRSCSGDSGRSWAEVIDDLGQRGLRWPGVVEVRGAAREFAHALTSAGSRVEPEVQPVILPGVVLKDVDGHGSLRSADEFARGCGDCAHGRCARRGGGGRAAAEGAGLHDGAVHHF